MPDHYDDTLSQPVTLTDQRMDMMRRDLGSGLYGRLQDMGMPEGMPQEQPQQQAPPPPQGQPTEDPSFWARLADLASTVFTGPDKEGLSVARDTRARNQALIQGGLYTVLAAQSGSNAFESVAAGILHGREQGAAGREREAREQAGGSLPAALQYALAAGDDQMVDALMPMMMTRGINTGQGTLVGSDTEGFGMIADDPNQQIISTPNGYFRVNLDDGTLTPLDTGPPVPDWEKIAMNDGDTLFVDPKNVENTHRIEAGAKYLNNGGYLIDVSQDPPIPVGQFTDPADKLSAEREMKNDYDRKTDRERHQATSLRNIGSLAEVPTAQVTAAHDIALVVTFVHMTDPGVSARQGEVETVLNIPNLLNRTINLLRRQGTQNAPFLSQATRDAIRDASLVVARTSSDALEADQRATYLDMAQRYDIEESLFGNPLADAIGNNLPSGSPDPAQTLEQAIEEAPPEQQGILQELLDTLLQGT